MSDILGDFARTVGGGGLSRHMTGKSFSHKIWVSAGAAHPAE
jgi:hypothetical protein